MGSSESRCCSRTRSDKPMKTIIEKRGEDETEAFITPGEAAGLKEAKRFVDPEEVLAVDYRLDVPLRPVSRPLLEFAHKMSEDIVAQALQLCWEVENRYRDLPFIDCDYVI